MIIVKGDFWKLAPIYDVLSVPTNGVLKNSGELVMGAGLALDFKKRFHSLPIILGSHVRIYGNRPCFTYQDKYFILSVPSKNHWQEQSNLNLIKQSLSIAKVIVPRNKKVLMTPPGCGLGGLKYNDVQSLLERLDDRFHVCLL